MLKTLLKKQMLELNQSFFRDKRTGKRRSNVSALALILLFAATMIVIIGGMFYFVAKQLSPLILADMGWLYFIILGLVSLVLGVFGSVFNTFSSLYQARDNDLLLSLPVPVPKILIVRLLGVYLMGLMYSWVVFVPAVIVYLTTAPLTAANIVGPIIFALIISAIVLVLSCILGWGVAKITEKLKNKSFITVIAALAFMGVYMYVYYGANEMLQQLITNSTTIGADIQEGARLLYLIGRASTGDWVSLCVVLAVVIVILWLTYMVLSRSFLKIATGNRGAAKVKYREKTAKVRNADGALLSKELKHFVSSPTYMLNCSLGTLILVVAAVFILIQGGSIIETLSIIAGNPGDLALICCAAVCMLSTMNDLTAPSISLEGKSIWLAQSLPVTPWQALKAKLNMHMLMTAIPTVLCSICLVIILQPSFLMGVLLVVLPLIMVFMCGELGLVLNLKMPNLNWVSEAVAVKQSVGVMLALLAGWIYVGIFAVIYMMVAKPLGAETFLIICTAVTICISWLLLRLLKSWGCRRFASL